MRKKTNGNTNSNKSTNRRPKVSKRSVSRQDKRNVTESDDETLTKDRVRKSGNDPAWYAADPVLLRDAASFPFSWPTGATETHDLSLWSSTYPAPYSKVPGICTYITVPNLGFNLRATDPINVAAQSVYSFVRHANSGHSNYDAPDLMLYILAMANAYSYLVWCQRLYGYALTYDQRNRYIPNELIRLNNVDPDSIRNNLANFRFWINTLIAKMASFAVPNTFSVFSRMSFMYSDYYVEGTSVKEQLYQFAPDGFYKFELDSDSKGKLTYVPFDRSQLMSVNDVMTYGNTLFGSVWDEEDFGIMSGDILKAYQGNIIKLVAIPEAYSIAPKFDPMVLTQMKNATLLDAVGTDITQSATGLIIQVLSPRNYTTSDTWYATTVTLSSNAVLKATDVRLRLLKDSKALTVDTDDPTPDIVMEASRLMYGYDAYLGELRVGTEFISKVILTEDIGTDVEFTQLQLLNNGAGYASHAAMIHVIEVYKQFHYVPRIYWVLMDENATNWPTYEWFDLDNFAILDNADIAKLHQAAVINMYAVPSIGKVQ